MRLLRRARSVAALGAATALMTTVGAAAFTAPAHADPFTVRAESGLNVRSGPSLNYRIIGHLVDRAHIDSTGPARNGWIPITFQGRQAWVSEAHLQPAGHPVVRGKAYTTAPLNVRTGPGLNYRIITTLAEDAEVEMTGVIDDGYTQIFYRGERRWVSTQYLAATPGAPTSPAPPPSVGRPDSGLPAVTGTKYATATLLLRANPSDGAATFGTVPIGTGLQVTGRVENGRAEVVHQGNVRWVTAQYLRDTAPVQNEINLPGLTPNSQHLLREIQRNFPEARTIYGVRPDPLPDHPSGRALDLMTYNDRDLGNRAAEWARANAGSLNIEYIIWDQRIWSVARANEGWRFMADRGSATANHKDHVHFTVKR